MREELSAAQKKFIGRAALVITALAILPLLVQLLGLSDTCALFDFGAPRAGCRGRLTPQGDGGVTDLIYTPDGRSIIISGADASLRIWSADEREPRLELRGHTDWVTSVDISADGSTIVSSGWDDTIRVWRTSDGQLLQTLTLDDDGFEVAIAPDGQTIALADWDQARFWRIDGTPLPSVPANESRTICFSPDSSLVAVGGREAVSVFKVSDGTLVKRLPLSWASTLAFSADGALLAAGTDLGVIHIWSLPDLEPRFVFGAAHGEIRKLSFSHDGTLLLVSADSELVRDDDRQRGKEPTIYVWRTDRRGFAPWKLHQTIETDEGRAHGLSLAPDGKNFAFGDRKAGYVWRVPASALEEAP